MWRGPAWENSGIAMKSEIWRWPVLGSVKGTRYSPVTGANPTSTVADCGTGVSPFAETTFTWTRYLVAVTIAGETITRTGFTAGSYSDMRVLVSRKLTVYRSYAGTELLPCTAKFRLFEPPREIEINDACCGSVVPGKNCVPKNVLFHEAGVWPP